MLNAAAYTLIFFPCDWQCLSISWKIITMSVNIWNQNFENHAFGQTKTMQSMNESKRERERERARADVLVAESCGVDCEFYSVTFNLAIPLNRSCGILIRLLIPEYCSSSTSYVPVWPFGLASVVQNFVLLKFEWVRTIIYFSSWFFWESAFVARTKGCVAGWCVLRAEQCLAISQWPTLGLCDARSCSSSPTCISRLLCGLWTFCSEIVLSSVGFYCLFERSVFGQAFSCQRSAALDELLEAKTDSLRSSTSIESMELVDLPNPIRLHCFREELLWTMMPDQKNGTDLDMGFSVIICSVVDELLFPS